MKKLLLILCILSNSVQIFCSHEESTSQELDFEALKPKIIVAINEGTNLEEIKKIRDLYPDLFSQFINNSDNNEYESIFLHKASFLNDSKKIQQLIYLGANVNQIRHGVNALHYAAKNNAYLAIKSLIAAGADVNQERGGETPLHVAANNDAIKALCS
ncbi:MAG: ankyrin repeat domain-containing protein [Candidatus Dependentiae bacterium]|nr:ankyrin repeat domain-containing protein [Candidatus Dependentiae bacterium]